MSDMVEEKKQHRKKPPFTDEFKTGVIQLVIREGKTVAEVSRDLDLVPSAVAKWVKQSRIDAGKGPPGALTSARRRASRRSATS